jgi:hypothetical protein
MTSTIDDEASRTSPLAFWRYAHDHLRVAHDLARMHRIPCVDSQVAYHVGAQGIEFALKSFLRARGVTIAQLRAEVGHSLMKALARSEEQGLPFVPPRFRAAITQVAVYHQNTHFLYRDASEDAFPEVDPVVDAGIYVLDCIAPDVAEHFVVHFGGSASPTVETFVSRLRADLSATAGGTPSHTRGDGLGPPQLRHDSRPH